MAYQVDNDFGFPYIKDGDGNPMKLKATEVNRHTYALRWDLRKFSPRGIDTRN